MQNNDINFSKSNLKLVIIPVADLQQSISAIKSTWPLLFAEFPFPFKHVPVAITVCSIAMKVISAKAPFIGVTVGKLEYSYAMLHATAPIPFVLGPRQEIIPAVPVDLVISENAGVPFPIVIVISPPAVLLMVLHLAFIIIAIAVSDLRVAVSQNLS